MSTKLVDEVHVPGLAAQLTVGRRPETDLLLHSDHLADGSVLDLPEPVGAEPAGGEVFSGPQYPGRPQQATDVVRAERRPSGRPRRGRIGMRLLILVSGHAAPSGRSLTRL